jgi:hypothetical protein
MPETYRQVCKPYGVVSKHMSRVNHTSDFQNRSPPGVAAGRPPRRASFCISMQPPGPPGGVGLAPGKKVGGVVVP